MDWRAEWENQGGAFGWLHRTSPPDPDRDNVGAGGYGGFGYGFGNGGGYGRGGTAWNPGGVGGGGWYGSELTRMRMWNDRMREERAGKDWGIWEGEKPGIWEVGLEMEMEMEMEKKSDREGLVDYTVRTLSLLPPFCVHS